MSSTATSNLFCLLSEKLPFPEAVVVCLEGFVEACTGLHIIEKSGVRPCAAADRTRHSLSV
eukprot:6198748-Pleurochrysis_carterae.AAC.2